MKTYLSSCLRALCIAIVAANLCCRAAEPDAETSHAPLAAERIQHLAEWLAISMNLTSFKVHTERVFGVTFGPYGTLLTSCSEDNTIRLWDPRPSTDYSSIIRRLPKEATELLERIRKSEKRGEKAYTQEGKRPYATFTALPQAIQEKLRPKIVVLPEDWECPICYNTNDLAETPIKTPCGHMFHKECADGWLKEHRTCPLCRTQLPPQ